MTPEFALKICKDFLPVRNKETGKMTCTHKVDELCMHQDHFLCELVTYKRRKEHKDERGDIPAISVSRGKTLEECARKYGFIYDYHAFIEGDVAPAWKIVGNIFTVGRAKIDMNLDRDFDIVLDQKNPYRYDIAKAKAALDYYKAHPPYPVGSVTCEDEIYIARDSWWFTGYLDAMTLDGKTIREWKYAATKYTKLQVIRQAAIYLMGYPKATKFEMWKFPKPNHRPSLESLKQFCERTKLTPNKDEPAEAFYERVGMKPIANEDVTKFYKRVRAALFEKDPREVYEILKISRDEVPVQNIIRQMIARHKTLPVLQDKGYPPSYGMGCSQCEYEDPCTDNLGKSTEEIAKLIKDRKNLETIGKDNELTEATT